MMDSKIDKQKDDIITSIGKYGKYCRTKNGSNGISIKE